MQYWNEDKVDQNVGYRSTLICKSQVPLNTASLLLNMEHPQGGDGDPGLVQTNKQTNKINRWVTFLLSIETKVQHNT